MEITTKDIERVLKKTGVRFHGNHEDGFYTKDNDIPLLVGEKLVRIWDGAMRMGSIHSIYSFDDDSVTFIIDGNEEDYDRNKYLPLRLFNNNRKSNKPIWF